MGWWTNNNAKLAINLAAYQILVDLGLFIFVFVQLVGLKWYDNTYTYLSYYGPDHLLLKPSVHIESHTCATTCFDFFLYSLQEGINPDVPYFVHINMHWLLYRYDVYIYLPAPILSEYLVVRSLLICIDTPLPQLVQSIIYICS